MNLTYKQYLISDDKNLLQIETIAAFLAKSYWADQRPLPAIEQSIRNSLCFGVYHDQRQIGFARAVTDYATIYYLADVYIDEEYRGEGIGKALVHAIIHCEALAGLRGLLGTRDAHELYEQYDFVRDGERCMYRAADAAEAAKRWA